MKDKGILINPGTGDLLIQVFKGADGKIAGGLQIGNVTQQNIRAILYIQPGELKLNPTVGVGIGNMILSHDALFYKHKIRQQLNADGMQVNKLNINGQNIEIDAGYK